MQALVNRPRKLSNKLSEFFPELFAADNFDTGLLKVDARPTLSLDTKSPATLFHGDCLKIMADLPDECVNMVMADLPYGTTSCSWDTVLPFSEIWDQLLRITTPRATLVFTAHQPFTSQLVMSNPNMFHHECIWEKPRGTCPFHAKYMPMKNHENILIFNKGPIIYNPIITHNGKPYRRAPAKDGIIKYSEASNICRNKIAQENDGSRYPTSVIPKSAYANRSTIKQFPFPKVNGLHPTQKPIELMQYLISTYSNSGDTVLDPTMGSGSTGVAAILSGRKFVGIEQIQSYFELSTARINEAMGHLTA